MTKDHWPENTKAFWHKTGKMLLPRNGYWEVDKNGTRRIKRFRHTRKDFDIDNAMDAHCNFLREYGLSKSDVPLLSLDPLNWDAPFSAINHTC